MKMAAHNNKLDTNSESETQEFGIGDASVVIEILRNRLYENKIQTLVQEYICNARDALREIGEPENQIQITVPTRLNPVFKVRDFGPGVSPDRIKNVFIMYGASTKRGTNNQTGGFGIGAKSAWSYTDSFSIVTHIDQVRRVYVAHTGVNNNGRLDLVETTFTDEQNGTEIQVAVKQNDLEEFRASIFRAIYFWENKPTIKGELNLPPSFKGLRLNKNLALINNGDVPDFIGNLYSSALAVIDGVPYILGQKILDKLEYYRKAQKFTQKRIVLHFGNGLVEVSASRESIADSPKSISALNGMMKDVATAIQDHIKAAFAKPTSPQEYLSTYLEISKSFFVDEFAEYGDYKISSSNILSKLFHNVVMTKVTTLNNRGRRVNKVTKNQMALDKKRIAIDQLPNVFFLDKAESKVVENKRAREFFKGMDMTFILLEPQSNAPKEFAQVIADLGAKPFSSITYVDPPKVAKVKVLREDSEICLHVLNGTRHKYTTLKTNTTKWYYVPVIDGMWQRLKGTSSRDYRDFQYYLEGTENAKVCGLAPRALEMVKGDPNFVPFLDWYDNYTPGKNDIAWAKSQVAINNNMVKNFLSKLQGLKDPYLLDIVKEYESCIVYGKFTPLPDVLEAKLKELPEVKSFKEKDVKLTQVLSKNYPLIKSVHDTVNSADWVLYINAKYAANKKGSK